MTIKLKTVGLLCVLVLISCSTETVKQSDVLENRETAKASDIPLKMGNDAHKKGDYAMAVEMYRKAAEQGQAEAQFKLGQMYNKGQGVTQNRQKAVKWFRKAAEQGLTLAQYNLGVMYHHGLGITQNHQQALNWFRKAAEQGFSLAQYNLGVMYETTQNHQEAVKWYRKAAEQGLSLAQKALKKLSAE